MRLKFALLFAALTAFASAQVWEKPIAPGLVYHMEIDSVTPRVIHALRFSPGSPTKAMTELAGKTVYEETASKGCETVSQMVAEEGAIAGLNGDFFPYTGHPLGAMVRSGELITVPTVPRAGFAWSNDEGSGTFGIMNFRGSYQVDGNDFAIDTLNGECKANSIALNTETAGYSLAKAPDVHVVVRLDHPDFSPNGTTTGTVQGMTADEGSFAVPKGSVVLVAQGNKVTQLASLRAGDKIVIRFQSDGIDWRKVDQLIGGGPFVLKDGSIAPDSEAEKFKPEFYNQRHPRSAVGKTASGDFWFVTVDGRQPMSEGATIRELGEVMLKLGCRDAINLDGGGSSDMNILGVNVNRPSDGFERPVANAILFFGPRAAKTAGEVSLDGPATMDMSTSVNLHAIESGKQVGDADVIWSAQGGAWIDQGGLLKAVKPGVATVTALVKGQVVSKEITVIAPPAKKPRTSPVASRGGDRNRRKKGKGG